jgi:hypothetical protein
MYRSFFGCFYKLINVIPKKEAFQTDEEKSRIVKPDLPL